MNERIRAPEAQLLVAVVGLALLAMLAPPLTQPAGYHHFADQRGWLGMPRAMDVLSNLPFAVFGWAGLRHLGRLAPWELGRAQRALCTLFFAGLLMTAACSAWYHWQPDDAGLVVDRLGMSVAFAGLLGLGVADRISARTGVLLALAVLLLGPLSIDVWMRTGNVLPWATLQIGGVLLLLVLAFMARVFGALNVRWDVLVLIYAVAKALELADQAVFEWSEHWVSGHSLKHVVAAAAAWPVIHAIRRLGQNGAGRLGRLRFR